MKMEFKFDISFFFLLINIFISQLSAQECFTGRGEPGTCMEILQCPPFVQILKGAPLSQDEVRYLQQSRCLNYAIRGSEVYVCCPSIPQTSTYRPSTSTYRSTNIGGESAGSSKNFDLRNHPLLPSNCGEQNEDRIFGGERTDIDEFPWMVLLEYLSYGKRTTQCAGALINNRYVVTAGHCVKNLPTGVKLLAARLGEYDTSQEIDCINQAGYQACADPAISIPIEEQIVHEFYQPTKTNKKNDIALLRLAREVTYTDFIKPICLPQNPRVGNRLDVVGWGAIESYEPSNIKHKVSLPFVPQDTCARIYDLLGSEIGAGQFCAGGERGKDSCGGDSGGPIMMKMKDDFGNRFRWVSVGIVSYGLAECGAENRPGVYTKTHEYVPWMLSKLKP